MLQLKNVKDPWFLLGLKNLHYLQQVRGQRRMWQLPLAFWTCWMFRHSLVLCIGLANLIQPITHVALGKWKQLRDGIRTKAKYKRLLIRPSLTKEELEREREERNKKWKMKEMNNITTRGSGK
uniref:Uncharacterized protein n=1 Tax=Meloidogyne incognita TaxID=6306 RepID=A0A914M8U6_MELIC